MPWADLDQGGNILNGLFSNKQSVTQVLLDDTDSRVIAFLAASATKKYPDATQSKLVASTSIDGNPGYSQRAMAAMSIAQFNNIWQRISDMDNAVKNATSLVNLQARWAALSPVLTLTLAQAKTAFKNSLSGNALDE